MKYVLEFEASTDKAACIAADCARTAYDGIQIARRHRHRAESCAISAGERIDELRVEHEALIAARGESAAARAVRDSGRSTRSGRPGWRGSQSRRSLSDPFTGNHSRPKATRTSRWNLIPRGQGTI